LGATTDIAGVAFFKHCFRREINHTCRAVQQVKDCPESINRYALVPAARLPRWSHLSGICWYKLSPDERVVRRPRETQLS